MKKRIFAALLSLCVTGGSILWPTTAQADGVDMDVSVHADAEAVAVGYNGLDTEYHTQDQIREYYNSHPIKELEAEYVKKPSVTAPYALGELTEAAKQDALNALNIYRYIAGVPEAPITDQAQKYAQAAALVFAANRELSHSPSSPEGMGKELYSLAVYGAYNSNIAALGNKLSDTIRGYMLETNGDADFGHRRQLLDYNYKEAGFGLARSESGGFYSATFVGANLEEDKAVCYPGQNQPLEYFGTGYAWTVIIPERVDKSKINIKLTDMKTGNVWNFNQNSGGFRLDASRGASACAIFSPYGINYRDGDRYKVEITGIERPIAYEVNMFYLNDPVPLKSMNFQWAGCNPFEGEDHYTCRLIFNPENATNRIVEFSSSNPEIAEAVWAGTGVCRIIAKKVGTSVITATSEDGGHMASLKVKVEERASGLELDKTNVTIGVGQSFELSGKALPAESSDMAHYDSNYDKRVIKTEMTTVGGRIKVTGLAVGQTEIQAYLYSNPDIHAVCRVNVVEPVYATDIRLDAAKTEIGEKESILISAAFSPSNVTCKEVEWKTNNSNVRITKSEDGRAAAEGISPGPTVITAKALDGSNRTASCTVTVYGQYGKTEKPTVRSYTSDKVVLKSIDGCEYSMDVQNWQDSNEFSNLQPDHEYTFYMRKKATEYVKAGEASDGTAVKTRIASTAGSDCVHKNTMIQRASEATCTKKGYTGNICCADCLKVISYGKETNALGHNYVSKTENPSGSKDGAVTYACTRCGDSYTKKDNADSGSGKTPAGSGTALPDNGDNKSPENNKTDQSNSVNGNTPGNSGTDQPNGGSDKAPVNDEPDHFNNDDGNAQGIGGAGQPTGSETGGGIVQPNDNETGGNIVQPDDRGVGNKAVKVGDILTSGYYKYKVAGYLKIAFIGFNGRKPASVKIPDTVTINGKTFKVTSVGSGAFLNSGVKSVSIGSNVKEIGASAFRGCRKLRKVTLGSGITKIGKNAFRNCAALKSIMIPAKVSSIGAGAFSGCGKLAAVNIRSLKLRAVGGNAFKGISKSAIIKAPSKKLSAYKKLLKNKGQDKKVKITK